MRIEHIRYFIKVANEGSINRAAERLHLTHQNLGRIVSAMEAELGMPLLRRDAHGVALTEEGRLAYEEFRRIVKGYDGLLDRASARREGDAAEPDDVHLYVADNMLQQSFSETLSQVRSRFPLSRLAVVAGTTADALRGLETPGEAYANILIEDDRTKGDFREHGLDLLIKRRARLVLYLPVQMSGIVRGGSVDASALSRVPLVLYSSATSGDDVITQALSRHCTPNVRYRTNDFSFFASLLATGECATASAMFSPESPLTGRMLQNSVLDERSFMAVPVLVRRSPIHLFTCWLARAGQQGSETGKYLLSLL